MKILIAGATGVVGRQLTPKLVAAGHEVAGTTRTPSKEDVLREAGATPFVMDVLDPEAVARVVGCLPTGGHRPRGNRAIVGEHARLRACVCGDQSPAHRGDGSSSGGRSGHRRPTLRGAELCRLALCAQRAAGQDRGRSPRPRSHRADAHHARCPASPRGRRHRRRLDRGDRPSLRRPLRSRHFSEPGRRRNDGDDPSPILPDRGQR